jgi:hypothetical protein
MKIYHYLNDPYAKLGLRHFLNKYRLSVASNIDDADIFIGYSEVDNNLVHNVKIQLNQGSQEIMPCYLEVKNEAIPIFKMPVKTLGDISLANIKSDHEEYTCISIINNRIIIGFDIFQEIGLILSGYYDAYYLKTDRFGMMLREIPIVDVLEQCLFEAICLIKSETNYSYKQMRWPGEKKFAVALTHDVDRVYKTFNYLPYIFKSINKLNWHELKYHLNNIRSKRVEDNPFWTFDEITNIENSLGVKSTYYFLDEKGKPKLFNLSSWWIYCGRYDIETQIIQNKIRELHRMGFEIGVHGSFNSFLDAELLQLEKGKIESIIKSKVTGIRQHYLNYDFGITSKIQDKCGFKYDTSIGYKTDSGIGFRRGTSFPFQIILPDGEISSTLEIPLIIMDVCVNSENMQTKCFKIMDNVEKYGGVLTLLWHTDYMNKTLNADNVNLYRSIIIEATKRNAWITRADEIFHWVSRNNT